MDSEQEQFIKRQVSKYLGIDERHIFGSNVGDRLIMAIANDVANLSHDDPNLIIQLRADGLRPLTISKFDKSVFVLDCHLRFLKCTFNCDLFGNFKKISNIIYFESCIFKKKVYFSNSTFSDQVYFSNSTFSDQVDFSCSTFSDQAYLSNSIFSDRVNFYGSTFSDQVHFSYSTFQKEVDFSRSIFHNIVSFYDVLFEDMINFVEAYFEKGINLVNSQLELNFDVLKSKVEGENKIPKLERANDCRDTFRLLKQSLIKDGNHLDASSYHRAELYAKEIELKYSTEAKLHKAKKELKKNAASTDRDFYIKRINQKLSSITIATELKNSIDRIQLWFYRHTSDHHTDLLRIINSIVALIGYFALLMYVANSADPKPIVDSMQKYPFTDFWESCIEGLLFVLGGLCLAALVFLKNLIKTNKLHDKKANKTKYTFTTALWGIFFLVGYVLAIPLIMQNPKFILGFTSLFGDNTYNVWQNIIIVLYTILFAILLFSLQKTARKNSIIPS